MKNNNLVSINREALEELQKQINLLALFAVGEESTKALRNDCYHYEHVIYKVDKSSFASQEDARIKDLTDLVFKLRKMVQEKS